MLLAGALVVVALVAGVLVWRSRGGDERLTLGAGEVFLEPKGTAGPEAFTTDIPVREPASIATTTSAAPSSTSTSTSTTSSTSSVPASTATPPPTTTGVVLTTTIGSTPGLYGGTQNLASCDPQQMQAFLASHADKAAAWVAALNADPTLRWSGGTQVTTAQIPAFLAELTPVVLTEDTRVTNHGYRDGAPTPRQAVLQAGTAVLVDRYGVPRAKCACGNPLAAPVPTQDRTVYRGDTWSGFDPGALVVVQPAPAPVDAFALRDTTTGVVFTRPAGTSGASDVPTSTVPPTTTRAPTTTTSTSTSSTSTTAPPKYAVYLLTNLAGGSIYVGTEAEIGRRLLCQYPGGGECKGDGTDAKVTWVRKSDEYATFEQARLAYCRALESPPRDIPLTGGAKAKIYGGDYWVDTAPAC